jgi:ring-1,2-phenylacetyl-CoA epoxidase subunit PaaC
VLAAIAAKAVRELTYHRDYAAQWLLRLAGGTDYSRARMIDGLAAVAPFGIELFAGSAAERELPGVPDPASLRPEVDAVLAGLLERAGLDWPEVPAAAGGPGREGAHTPALAEILAEMQSVARATPGATW